jgi:hypothetical protein
MLCILLRNLNGAKKSRQVLAKLTPEHTFFIKIVSFFSVLLQNLVALKP